MLFKSLLFASTASATCLHGLSMFKRAAGSENGTVEVNTFGYGPENGPFNWASLAPENEACRTGTNQSPINIDASIGAASARPVVDIPDQSVEFENLGTTIEVIVNGTTSFAGTDFRLVQFHMHTPSEHHINDEFYPLEVHMVHQGVLDNTKLAVIALMFQTTIGDGLDFSSVINKVATSDILQYSGSLTTPPCAEGVTFLIVKDPLDIGVADFNAIKSIVKFNSRFIQNTIGGENILEIGANSGSVLNATK
ncbi:alpha carbonic anhydrase [Boeremia exigua]|uniref:alpha carbonic anhydrase n=1 Tax=Boeremia exigua TaxID=749465 RepID=UPI001E8EAAB5|nr:alpha carbonic anhydrase [Boeremia exigua]KAH6620460.1 alpha carbonic anhydrase [Boeremia exigua]